MKTFVEELYWLQFPQYIHYEDNDHENDFYHYDPNIPLRVRKSFENWLRVNSKCTFKNTMKQMYADGVQPVTTYGEALELALVVARQINRDIEACVEYETAYVFQTHEDLYQHRHRDYASVVIMKATGQVLACIQLAQNGISGKRLAFRSIKNDENGGICMDAIKDFLYRQNWTFAKTYADKAPHEYIVRDKINGEDQEFIDAVVYIRENGIPMSFWGKQYIYLHLDGRLYRTMGDPIEDTVILNRCCVKDCEITIKTAISGSDE